MRTHERIIREQFAERRCSECNALYPPDGVLILAHRHAAWVVMAVCGECQRRGIFFVSFPAGAPESPTTEHHPSLSYRPAPHLPALPDPLPAAAPPVQPTPDNAAHAPVTEDDVAAMHAFLASFDGDFRHAFATERRRTHDESAS